MEENSNPSPDSNTNNTNSSSNRNQTTDHLHLLNKTSHKISKSHHHQHLNHTSHNNNSNNQQQQQPQPPVYNIDKSDFRQLVQKLTSSPSPPPPPTNPSSRLHRIRPPPLAHVTNDCPPPPLLNDAGAGDGQSRSPFSPLPPFPTVSIAAESPISAYLRYLRSSVPTSADADLWRSHNPSSVQPMSSSSAAVSPFLLPATSPLAFGHIPHLSPSSQLLGFQSLPLSPGLPVPSPRWKDM